MPFVSAVPESGERGPVPAFVVWDPELLTYDFGLAHPMAPRRLDLTMRLVRELGLLDRPGVTTAQAPVASDEILRSVHEAAYVAAVRAASTDGRSDPARGLGTEDDPVFAGMHEAAARIVGGSYAAAGAVWSGAALHAVNVAGGMHHAMPGAASGFCVYSDAAVAIRRLLGDGARRVAYIDLDAHHGDGVERVFWEDPRVLTVSIHQSGQTLFPGTGAAGDTGADGAEGTAVNIPLPPRTDGAQWLRALDAVVPALLAEFRPDVLVSQHGCDAHGEDPMSDLRVCLDAQRLAARWVHQWSHRFAAGRWVALGGGGYAIARVVPLAWSCVVGEVVHAPLTEDAPLPASWRAYVAEMIDDEAPATIGTREIELSRWAGDENSTDEVDRAILATRRAVFPQWGLDPLRG